MKGKIRVFCRVRPMSQSEKDIGSLPVVTVIDQYSVRIRLKKEATSSTGGPNNIGYKDEDYSFDSCFGEAAT